MDLSRKTETKDFKFTFTEVDETEGMFKGYASIFGTVDTYGDAVKKGAFKRSLREQKKFPMLWSHQVNEPIGIITGREDETGLQVEGQLNLDVQRAREVRSLMKQGAVEGLSIGYQTVIEDIDKETGTRVLKELKLWEISPVVFPACPGASVSDVKAALTDDGHRPECHGEDGEWTPVFDCPECQKMVAIAKAAAVELELKPYPNEHACRLRDPGDFQEGSFKRTTREHEGKEYSIIMGKLKGDTTMTEQAYRYSKETWTAAEAKAHCKAHDGASFEPASGKCAECGAFLDEEPGTDDNATLDALVLKDIGKTDPIHLLDKLIFKI